MLCQVCFLTTVYLGFCAFYWNFWMLWVRNNFSLETFDLCFLNLLVFVKGFGISKGLFNVNKERIFYSVRYKQKLLLSLWSVLRNLGFSSDVDYCMSLWKLHNLKNGFIYTGRNRTWYTSLSPGNIKHENTVFSVPL